MAVTAEIWNKANTSKVNDVTAVRANVQRRVNDVGRGSLTVLLDDTNIANVVVGNVVRLYDNSVLCGSFTIERTEDNVIDPDEEAGETRTATGRGLLARLERGLVQGWVAPGSRPQSRTRVFNWASPTESADITAQFVDTIYTQPRDSLLWGDDRPVGWPDPYSSWMWTRDPDDPHPAGDVYFRCPFTLADPATIVIFLSADDDFELWVDGVLIQTQHMDPPSDVWWWTWRSGLVLPAGGHVIGVKVNNISSVGPGGLIMSVWEADAQAGIGDPIFVSGDPTDGAPIGEFVACEYPTTVPGWTAGEIVDKLIDEAQTRGSLTGVTVDFTGSTDTASGTFQVISEFAANVGDSVLDVVQALSEAWADVDAIAPIDVQLYDKDDSPPGSSGVTLTEGSNITSLSLISGI